MDSFLEAELATCHVSASPLYLRWQPASIAKLSERHSSSEGATTGTTVPPFSLRTKGGENGFNGETDLCYLLHS